MLKFCQKVYLMVLSSGKSFFASLDFREVCTVHLKKIYYLLNWLDRDNVAPGGTLGYFFPPKDLFGDSKSAAIDNPELNFLGDSKVLWPLLGEAIEEKQNN